MSKFTDGVDKEIIYAEKMIKWLSKNAPNTDLTDLKERLDQVKSSISMMKKAYSAAEKVGVSEKDFERSISFPNFHDLFLANIENADMNAVAKGIMKKLVTKSNVAMVQTLWTEGAGLMRASQTILEGAIGASKQSIEALTNPMRELHRNQDVTAKDFGSKVDVMLKSMGELKASNAAGLK